MKSVQSGERRLVAIMFTDIVGYTRLSQVNEPLALQLLEEHQDLLRPAFQAHGGTEVKTIGDAFLIEFKSALDAVLCAVDLQKRLNDRNASSSPSRKLELRVGIHVGDVVHGSGDIYGDAVNVASRIEPLAEPGGVCISQQVFDQIRNKTDLRIEKVGDVKLRNVDIPQRVYKINMSDGNGLAETTGPRERLAVLPFVNISSDPNDEYFADGLTEELIAKLSEIRGLKVIARTSVMSYKHKEKKVSEIGAELGVGSVIEGSVRKSGSKVRISVQLVDARTEEHLWASNYNTELGDIFAVQSDVASKVAESLSAGLFPNLPKDTNDIEAYTLYLRAIQLSYEPGESTAREVVDLLQRAIARDPRFARAHADLASAWHVLAVTGHEDFAETTQRVEAEARKSLELDPGLAEGHAALAGYYSMVDRFDEALAEAETAVRINPNLSEAHMALGVLDMIMRTPADAMRTWKKAYELDPLSYGTAEMLAVTAMRAGDDKTALEVLERMKQLNPKNSTTYIAFADYYMEKGDLEEAQKMIDVARKFATSDHGINLEQAILFALAGKRREAEKSLAEILKNESLSEAGRLHSVFWVQSALGNKDAAFEALMRQAETHSWTFDIRTDPMYAEMRKDPRYLEFCRRVNIKP